MHDQTIQTGTCPVHAIGDGRPVVSRRDELVLPKHRRMVVQYATDAAGAATELRLYYDDKEIAFDEPELFAFGETLARQTRFTAGDAIGWGDGYEWPRIRDLLRALIEEGVLAHVDDEGAPAQDIASGGDAARPSPLPASTCTTARFWHDCATITRELAGRAIEPGYLELIVPVYRIAHIALDADQRQVGEANVFPTPLRLDVPTEWRTCNLPGTRYQSERPMNVSAMRVMRAHWPQMMAAALRVRAAYLRRFPDADGAWTVAHVERLTALVLVVPTYQLLRRDGRVANGALHPALSSLFRVTDGVRVTVHQMLYIATGEPTVPPDQPTTVDAILDYAERTYSFHSAHGVCAGPRAMVRELVEVLLEGRGGRDYASVAFDPQVQAAFDDLDAAIDYGLLGLRVYAAAFSLWPAMARAYARIAEAIEASPPSDAPVFAALRVGMRTHRELLNSTHLALEAWRASRETVYAYSYRECGRGLNLPAVAPGLDALLAPTCTHAQREAAAALQALLRRRLACADAGADAQVAALSAPIMDFLLRGQRVLRAAIAVQRDINRLLGRPQPVRAMRAADLDVYFLLQGSDTARLPFLTDALSQLLAIDVEVTADGLTIADMNTHTNAPTAARSTARRGAAA